MDDDRVGAHGLQPADGRPPGRRPARSATAPASTMGLSSPCSEPPPICGRSCQALYQKRTEPVAKTRAAGHVACHPIGDAVLDALVVVGVAADRVHGVLEIAGCESEPPATRTTARARGHSRARPWRCCHSHRRISTAARIMTRSSSGNQPQRFADHAETEVMIAQHVQREEQRTAPATKTGQARSRPWPARELAAAKQPAASASAASARPVLPGSRDQLHVSSVTRR